MVNCNMPSCFFYLDAWINLFLARSEETGKEEKIMFRTARPGNESCKTDKLHVK
jgi:hypothetical protein